MSYEMLPSIARQAREDFDSVPGAKMMCRYCGGVFSVALHSRISHVKSRQHQAARAGVEYKKPKQKNKKPKSERPSWPTKDEQDAEVLRGLLTKDGQTRRELGRGAGLSDERASKLLARLVAAGHAVIGSKLTERGIGSTIVKTWRRP